MFADFLKEGTAVSHASLEKKLIIQIGKISSAVEYGDLLRLLYPFHNRTSEKLVQFSSNHFYPDHDPARARSIESDLQYLGIRIPEDIAEEPVPHSINSIEDCWGIQYVLEGSTLGGRVITRILSRSTGIDPSAGFTFFNPYQELTAARWEKFKARLNVAAQSLNKQHIIDAANRFFNCYHQWICSNESVSYQ